MVSGWITVYLSYFGILPVSVVIIIGIGYLIVGLNIDQNHWIVLMGIIGKFLVFFFFTTQYIKGDIALLKLIIAIGDLIFAILFIEFLLNIKKLKSVNP
jgi:hypothetical protein